MNKDRLFLLVDRFVADGLKNAREFRRRSYPEYVGDLSAKVDGRMMSVLEMNITDVDKVQGIYECMVAKELAISVLSDNVCLYSVSGIRC